MDPALCAAQVSKGFLSCAAGKSRGAGLLEIFNG